MCPRMKLRELAEKIGAELHAARAEDGDRVVTGCGRLEDATPEEVTFLANPKYAPQLETTQAAAIIVGPKVECNGKTLLRAADPYYAFRNAVVALCGFRKHPRPPASQVSQLAVVDPEAVIGEG